MKTTWWHCDSCCTPGGSCLHPEQFKFCPNCGRKRQVPTVSALAREETLERLIKDKQADLDRVLAQLNEYERRLSNQSKLIGERTRERDEARAELERRGLTMGSDLREDRAEVERLRDELRKLIIENERLIQTSPDIGAVASRQRKETQEALIRVVMEVTGASPREIEIVETLGPDGLHTHVRRRP